MTGTEPSTISMPPDTYRPSIPCLSVSQSFSGDKLDHVKGNWKEWSRQILIVLALNGLKGYVKGTTSQPLITLEPRAHANWSENDDLALNFILQNIDVHEQEFILDANVTASKACWDALEKRHVNEGPMRQLQLIHEGMSSRFSHRNEPLPAAATKAYQLAKRTLAMGNLTTDIMACLFILSGLTPYPRLHTTVNQNILSATTDKPYTPADIIRLLENEQCLLDADKANELAPSVALTARAKPTRLTCSNCKKDKHTAAFCIAPGGGMAGKTLEEAWQASRDTHAKRTKGNKAASPSQPNGKTQIKVKDKNGRSFVAYLDSAETLSAGDTSHFQCFCWRCHR